MNTENVNIEQLRKAWIEMGTALNMNTHREITEDVLNRKTTLDKLRDRYRNIGFGDICGAAIMFPILMYGGLLSESYRLPVSISFVALLLVLSGFIFWMWWGVGKINPVTMTVTQVSELALHYRKCHMRFVMIGFPIALCWVGYFTYSVIHTVADAIGGIIAGSVVGVMIGLKGLSRFMSDYKRLESDQ